MAESTGVENVAVFHWNLDFKLSLGAERILDPSNPPFAGMGANWMISLHEMY